MRRCMGPAQRWLNDIRRYARRAHKPFSLALDCHRVSPMMAMPSSSLTTGYWTLSPSLRPNSNWPLTLAHARIGPERSTVISFRQFLNRIPLREGSLKLLPCWIVNSPARLWISREVRLDDGSIPFSLFLTSILFEVHHSVFLNHFNPA